MTEQAVPSENVALVQRVLEAEIGEYTPARVALIARTVAPPGTTADELALYLSFCQARDLNPLLKQVYMLKDKSGRMSIVTGIDGLRLLAQRSGEYEGQVGPEWKGAAGDEWDDVPPEDNLYACRVGVWRTGFKSPIWGVVRFSEFVKTESWAVNWRDRPSHMIAVRAESHALRKAFPAETAGVTVHYEGGVQVDGVIGDPDAPLTYPQLGQLHKLAKAHGWSRADRLGRAGVSSFNDLSKGEASELIDAWTEALETVEEGAASAAEGHRSDQTAVGHEPGRVGGQPEMISPGPSQPAEGAPGPSSAPVPAGPGSQNPEVVAPPPAGTPVQGQGGRSSKGKGESATRPADTSEGAPQGGQAPKAAPPDAHPFTGELFCTVCGCAQENAVHKVAK